MLYFPVHSEESLLYPQQDTKKKNTKNAWDKVELKGYLATELAAKHVQGWDIMSLSAFNNVTKPINCITACLIIKLNCFESCFVHPILHWYEYWINYIMSARYLYCLCLGWLTLNHLT